MSRKAQKRQSLIVSLSDHNQQELRKIQMEKEELIKDFEEKRAGEEYTPTLFNVASHLHCTCIDKH